MQESTLSTQKGTVLKWVILTQERTVPFWNLLFPKTHLFRKSRIVVPYFLRKSSDAQLTLLKPLSKRMWEIE